MAAVPGGSGEEEAFGFVSGSAGFNHRLGIRVLGFRVLEFKIILAR